MAPKTAAEQCTLVAIMFAEQVRGEALAQQVRVSSGQRSTDTGLKADVTPARHRPPLQTKTIRRKPKEPEPTPMKISRCKIPIAARAALLGLLTMSAALRADALPPSRLDVDATEVTFV